MKSPRRNQFSRWLFVAPAAAVLIGLFGLAQSQGAIVSITAPALDKWNYGNVGAIPSGDSQAAPTFAFFGDSGIDRLAGMLIGFDTAAAQVPKGLGASSYQITSVRVGLTVLSNNTFIYDPTNDSYRVHLPASDANYLPDSDAGFPVEVFGAGLRNGYTELSGTIGGSTGPKYHEYSPYGEAESPNVYPLGRTAAGQPLADVNDSVDQRSEAIPFGLGVASGLTPGSSVPADTDFLFDLAVSDPIVLAYLRDALNQGMLGLYISSLYPAVGQGGPVTYPRFYTKEGASDALAPEFAPRLEIEYTVVPEPSASVLCVAAVSLLAVGRGLRNRHRMS